MKTLTQTSGTNHSDNEIDLSQLFQQMLGNKWLILGITLTSVFLGGFYASRQIPQYQSNALIQLEENRNHASNMLGNVASQINFGGPRADPAAVQTALIKSRFILEPVTKGLGLDINVAIKQSFISQLWSKIKPDAKISLFNIPQQARNKPFTLIYDANSHIQLLDHNNKLILQGNIGQALVSKNDDVHLTVTHIHNPIGTKFILTKKTLADSVGWIDSRLSIRDLGDHSNVGILELSFRASKPQQAITILNKIAAITQEQDGKKKALEASKTLDFLYQQLPITKHDLAEAETKLNHYRAKSGKINLKLQTQENLRQLAELDKNIATLKLNKTQMSQQYTSAHPMITALTTQLKSLQQDRTNLEAQLKKLPETDQIAINLMREVKVKTQLYTMLLAKIHELNVVKAGTISDVHILSHASVPDAPLPGKTKLIYLASLVFGLMLSVITIVGRNLLFPRIEDPHWGEREFNILNLAIVPYCKSLSIKKRADGFSKNNLPLLAHVDPKNLSIEALRSLRTSLQMNLSTAKNNLISILGATPGVGKTFVTTNLAYLLASAGKRVLLIDGDLRRGTAHKYFNLNPSPGFAEVLSGSASITEAIRSEVHPNLSILPRGSYPADPSELLAGSVCENMTQLLAKQYDIVVIDTAPILLVTDGILLSTHSATNYLVLGAHTHQPADIEMAIKRLRSAGVNINGSIFNFHLAASTKKTGYYYRYYASSYYEDVEKT